MTRGRKNDVPHPEGSPVSCGTGTNGQPVAMYVDVTSVVHTPSGNRGAREESTKTVRGNNRGNGR